jgi:hypothetical protein
MGERNYWMIGADGKTYGPTDEATILRWIDERRITRSTQLADAADGPWRDAQAWPEFAGALGMGTESAATQPPPPPTNPSAAEGAPPLGWPPSGLQIVLLISAILNFLWAVGLIFGISMLGVATIGLGCLCFPLALIPLAIGIMQVMDYTAAARTDPRRYLDRTQMWGVINLIMLILGHIPAAVCGILQLVFVGEERRKFVR